MSFKTKLEPRQRYSCGVLIDCAFSTIQMRDAHANKSNGTWNGRKRTGGHSRDRMQNMQKKGLKAQVTDSNSSGHAASLRA